MIKVSNGLACSLLYLGLQHSQFLVFKRHQLRMHLLIPIKVFLWNQIHTISMKCKVLVPTVVSYNKSKEQFQWPLQIGLTYPCQKMTRLDLGFPSIRVAGDLWKYTLYCLQNYRHKISNISLNTRKLNKWYWDTFLITWLEECILAGRSHQFKKVWLPLW